MIVVEGPDGSGKTTLVKHLLDRYQDLPLLHLGERRTTDRDLLYTVTVSDTLNALALAVKGGPSPPRIWDRLYYSDFVYSTIQKRPCAFNASQQMHVDAVIEALRCPIIVCLPPRLVVLDNIASERHQMPGVRGQAEYIWERYNDMLRIPDQEPKGFPDWRVVFDYTDPTTLPTVYAEIDDYLDNRKERKA